MTSTVRGMGGPRRPGTAVPRAVRPQATVGTKAPKAALARHAATVGASGARVGDCGVRRRDPAAMTPTARLAELGALLATGLRRMRLSRETGLAEDGERERPCDSVDTPEEPTDQEVT